MQLAKWFLRVWLVMLLMSQVAVSLAGDDSAVQPRENSARRPLIRIDHMPLAVRDLDAAVAIYRRIGFTIKPGRFHADGIRNMHIKFDYGAGIELITARAPTDDLTRQYVTLLAQGEGPAFMGFYTPDMKTLEEHLVESGIAYKLDGNILEFSDTAIEWPFIFDTLNLAPDEKPEYFHHPNSADATLAVWIAGDDQTTLPLFKALGARVERKRVYVPDAVMADVATVAEGGEVIFLPESRQIISGRPIVGIVLRTKALDALSRSLHSGGFKPAAKRETEAYRSIFMRPEDTCGVWLEFRELR